MGPKIEAALRFLQDGGKEVVIAAHDEIAEGVLVRAGTRIVLDQSLGPASGASQATPARMEVP